MKVCLLTTSFPRFAGDYAGVFVAALGKELVAAGTEVRVVAPHAPGSANHEVMDGMHVHRFRYACSETRQRIAYGGGTPANLRDSWQARMQLPAFLASFLWQALRACRECDIIHASWIFAGPLALLVSRRYGTPVVLTAHGSDVTLFPGSTALNFVRKQVLRRVEKIIAVSGSLAEVVKALGVASEKIAVIPNGVDVDAFDSLSEQSCFDYRLLWIGRMAEEKGLEYLLRAMPTVLREYPQASLTLVGDGPLASDLKRLVDTLTIHDNVNLIGRVDHQQIPGFLARADIFVLPSLREGLPLVVLEAMAAGKPVVTTRTGGIPEVVTNGETGFLVAPGDQGALSEAVLQLLREPEVAHEMGRSGRARVEENYGWGSIANRTLKLYASIV